MAYVYRHIRLDKNEPFYIGIGTAAYFKRAKTSRGRNPIWNKIAAKTKWECEILFDDIPLEQAKEKEKEFIKLYGRIDNKNGSLANLSAGGDGMFDVSESVRKRLSIAHSGPNNAFYGKSHTLETRRKISELQRGIKRGPLKQSTRNKIGLANKGKGGLLKLGLKDPKGAASRSGVHHHSFRGEVYCYNAKGEYIKTYSCIGDAAKDIGVNVDCIRRVIIGNRNYVKKLIFSYSFFEKINPVKIKNVGAKSVINSDTGEIYSTINKAAKSAGINPANLSRYLYGKRKNITPFKFLNNQIV